MSDSNFKENIRSDSFWLNTLFLVVFLIVSRLLDLFLFVLTLVQWLFRLFTGEGHVALSRFSQSLGIYYQQVVHFLTGCTTEKPFPFMDWPVVASEEVFTEPATATEESVAETGGILESTTDEQAVEEPADEKAELAPIEYDASSTSTAEDTEEKPKDDSDKAEKK